MALRDCSECGVSFDPHSPAKRKAGGKIHHCPDCSEEVSTPYLGVVGGDGKQSSVSVIKFDSQSDRDKYQRWFQSVSGYNTGKNCQMGHEPPPCPVAHFTTVAHNGGNSNHKGKAS